MGNLFAETTKEDTGLAKYEIQILRRNMQEMLEEVKQLNKTEKEQPGKGTRGRPSHVKSLRDQAAGMQKSIDDKKNPAIASQNPTARRVNIAAGIFKEAERLESIQAKLYALAI